MNNMFNNSYFNGDISRWNVSKVENMSYMFFYSMFNGDLSDWKPYNLKEYFQSFRTLNMSKFIIPYWHDYVDIKERGKEIDRYHLKKELSLELVNHHNYNQNKKLKI